MRTTLFATVATVFVLLTIALDAGEAIAGPQDMRWSKFKLQANGVGLSVPMGVFVAPPPDDNAEGLLFVSHDGKAQLLLGAFENDDGRSIAAHRSSVVSGRYADANIDYAPIGRTWFVVSGTQADRTFYHRVSYSCAGRQINSWAMFYPTAKKRFYDRIVEQMHKSFEPGRGATGDCTFPSAVN